MLNREGFIIQFKKYKFSLKRIGSKKKIIASIVTIFIVFLSVFSVYILLQLFLNTQYPVAIVISNSMEPSINKGDLLFVRGTDPEDIKNGTIENKEGDIIVFNARGLWNDAPEDPVVHRVVNKWYNDTIQKWCFYTKGDANFHIDMAIILEERIHGVVFGKIPYIGMIKIILIDMGLYFLLIFLIVALLIISMIRDIIKDEDHNQIQKKTQNSGNADDSEELDN